MGIQDKTVEPGMKVIDSVLDTRAEMGKPAVELVLDTRAEMGKPALVLVLDMMVETGRTAVVLVSDKTAEDMLMVSLVWDKMDCPVNLEFLVVLDIFFFNFLTIVLQ